MLSERTIWGVIPEGFRKLDDGHRSRLVVRDDRATDIDFSICRDLRGAAGDGRYHGRAPLETISLRGGDRALVRRYRHGGLFRALTRDCFVGWPPRPFRELAITEELRRRGFRTVEVYAACVERVAGPFYRGCLVTRELTGAKDLWAALREDLTRQGMLQAVLKATAEVVHAMHDQGVYHSDLNLKNILIRISSGTVDYVIDFDKAKLFLGRLPVPLARKNLARFHRSALKLDPEQRYLSAAGWNEFLEFYHAAGR
jgi:3-deoxy-D-manno-octulosonic acid kinase